ncbi:hypothetical protein Ab1vBOLIVR5_gp25 [Agrobacterium phage OLIVR5]|uniref:Uncharacterized protein n=1 Tax=Agrobacterium phage OLIVR5 TaxID=2723773 RepID=A0A858MT20_9CAUD|nr:hypothetical protein KNU99_gp025 [Agrobacterium phage OLIVR5]QIW87673.1 hypothetical protein Ab1vBOLIVR5_gp25 [Agrobacterium phage OLIVR5]QIW87932.1 hypothetical protein Ab1vBOLIVR6_gp25 [Agrobacterium phage OLIVR6]
MKEFFIGRFKYSRSPIKKSHFKSFLVKNKIEVEVYVELCKTLPPLKALVELGFDLDAILYAKK